MANLANIIKLMDIKIDNPVLNNQVSGRKRRYWLSSEDNESDNNKTTTRQQQDNNRGNNKETISKQQDNAEGTTRQQRDNNQDIYRDNNEITKEQQPDENTKEISFFLIQNLIGIQKKIFNYIFNLCLEHDETNTGHISTATIASVINCSCGTIKVMLSRLEKKGLIKRLKGKGCRGGFVNFEVPKNIIALAFKVKKEFTINPDNNETTTRQQQDNYQGIYRDNFNYSSGNYINTTTTSNHENLTGVYLSTAWENLDIEPLAAIGFTKTHLFQISSQNKLSPQIVQDSIYAFAFDLQENNKAEKINGDKINFFMGILRTGRVYTFPSNYESPQDKAMSLYRESKRKIEQGRVEAEKEAITLAFNEWFSKLTDERKRGFLPENLRGGARLEKNKMLESSARNYFETEIWPDKKAEIIGNIKNTKKED